MKCYVIQFRVHNWAPWEVCTGREYDTLEEAKAALFAWLLPALISASLSRERRPQGDTQAGRTAQENGERNRGINRRTAESRQRNMDRVSTRG